MTMAAAALQSCIRGVTRDDQGFVATTWLKQMRSVDPDGCHGPRWGPLGRRVDAVFDRDDTRALIRHKAGDPHVILGWVVYAEGPKTPLLHFLYVRKEQRGQGYGSALLRAIGITRSTACVYTCRGPSTSRLLHAFKGAVHMPLEELLSP